MIINRRAKRLKFQRTASGRENCDCCMGSSGCLFFSLQYHNLARYLFITLAFAGLLSTGWFGIPLIPQYLIYNEVDILAGIFTLSSSLGTIWGVMAYREFTKSMETVIEARMAARKLDPMIGEYEYKSYNPITKDYESGFVPSGPVDFWDKETQVPAWMDKGKYWHNFLSLKGGSRDVKLNVVKDSELPFHSGPRNVAVTARKTVGEENRSRRQVYIVKIPQWLVLNTDRKRFADIAAGEDLGELVADANKKIVAASDEVAEWESQRIRYPWKGMTFVIYLNKSLPLKIVYRQVVRIFPGAKKRTIDETNANLANAKDEEIITSLLELASEKGIPENRIYMLRILLRFLKNAYSRLGLGEGASEYHSFHHSLEVSYMALHMIPKEFKGDKFGWKDYELILVAGLLHDYDPVQPLVSSNGPKGPSVNRTMQELSRNRILDAYFTMGRDEFENYFREFKTALSPPTEFATTHPEYIKTDWSPIESLIVESLIWRTDFPFFKQELAQKKFSQTLDQLASRGEDTKKVKLLAEILWLADLAVTYMSSDPVRAWDRVTNLYEELNLPKLEAVARTDAFFTDFSENETFRQIINMKHFPYIFRQRWGLIYQFFHEGNPSTQLNRTITTARRMYAKVNIEIGLRRGEMLQAMAVDNYFEYFIGIGKDQNEVFKTKIRLAELDPQNASAFWGDTEKLLPAISDRSIDNFFIVLPETYVQVKTIESKSSFRAMLVIISKKLVHGGRVRILTDLEKDGKLFTELVLTAGEAGFRPISNVEKTYFPNDWRDPEFRPNRKPQAVVLASK
jgi:tRNA G46 methylase TrmB